MHLQALEVLGLTRRRAEMHNIRWRNVQVPLAEMKGAEGKVKDAMRSLDALEEELRKAQRAAAQPKAHRFALSPVR
jgi:hypothetical protein